MVSRISIALSCKERDLVIHVRIMFVHVDLFLVLYVVATSSGLIAIVPNVD